MTTEEKIKGIIVEWMETAFNQVIGYIEPSYLIDDVIEAYAIAKESISSVNPDNLGHSSANLSNISHSLYEMIETLDTLASPEKYPASKDILVQIAQDEIGRQYSHYIDSTEIAGFGDFISYLERYTYNVGEEYADGFTAQDDLLQVVYSKVGKYPYVDIHACIKSYVKPEEVLSETEELPF